MVTAVEFLGILFLLFFLYVFVRPIVKGAFYFPTTKENTSTMVRLSDIKPQERMADIGSGDGRIVITFARAGAEAHGYEINPILVWFSRRAIRRAGLENKAYIHWQSFWREDFSKFNVVTIYGIHPIMEPLEEKLRNELPVGGRVLSNIYQLPSWSPKYSQNRVYLYQKEEGPGY